MKTLNRLFSRFQAFSLTQKVLLIMIPLSTISLVYILVSSQNTSPGTPINEASQSAQKFLDPQLSNLKTQKIILQINNSNIDIPSELPIYETSQIPTDIKTVAQTLANNLNLNKSPNYNNMWLSSDKSAYLSLNTKDKIINYSINMSSKKAAYSGKSPPDTNTALLVSKQFANYFPSTVSLKPDKTRYRFLLANDSEFTTSNINNYDLIEIYFHQEVNNLPLYIGSQKIDSASVVIGQNGIPVKFTLNLSSLSNLNQTQIKKTISLETASQKILAGQGKLVSSSYLDASQITAGVLPEITLTEISLAYHLDPNIKQAIPYYSFSGNYILNDEQKVDVTYLLPAVEP